MPVRRRVGIAIALTLSPAIASAQLQYVDEGRVSVFDGPGVERTDIEAGSRTVAEIVSALGTLCIAPSFDPAATASAVEGIGWRFAARPLKVPFTGPAYDAPIPQWASPDAILVSTSARMGGAGNRFHVAGPQCNLIVVPTGSVTQASAAERLTATLGEPVNGADAVKKNGKPNRSFAPRWSAKSSSGTPVDIRLFKVTLGAQRVERLMLSVVPAGTS